MSIASRRALLFAPLAVAAGGGAAFYAMLQGMRSGEYNPRGVPSALIGRRVPDFALPEIEEVGLSPVTSQDLLALRAPALVNFWASWCVPCVVEHPQLMRLRREGVPVFGIAYKDKPEDSRRFLRQHGNPFRMLSKDEPGRVAIDWGVFGVPETYLLDSTGVIRWRWAGPITPEVLDQDIRPLLRRYAA